MMSYTQQLQQLIITGKLKEDESSLLVTEVDCIISILC